MSGPRDQEAHPAGPGFIIEGKPLLFQFGDHDPRWPDRAPLNAASQGYRLEANGQPVFNYEFSGVTAEDRIAPLPDGSGLTRTPEVHRQTPGRARCGRCSWRARPSPPSPEVT